jgi:transaldolase
VRVYVDTADVERVERDAARGLIDGVTTNPSIAARADGSYRDLVGRLADAVDGRVFAQVLAEDADGMVDEGRAYDEWADEMVVKLPATHDGYEALARLREAGIAAGITVVFSRTQAALAGHGDATFVAPYVGRLDDAGGDGVAVVRDVQATFDAYGFGTEVLAASVRNVTQAAALYRAGVDAVTLPPDVLDAHVDHRATEASLAGFREDWGDRGSPLEEP